MSTLVPIPDRAGEATTAGAGKADEQRPQDFRHYIKPWPKRVLVVGGLRDTKVTMTVEVCHDTVWVRTFDEPFLSEAILQLAHVESLVEMLTWAGDQALKYREGNAT